MIDLPSGVGITNLNLSPINPDQSAVQYIRSGRVATVSHGGILWGGAVTLHVDPQEQRSFLAFVRALQGSTQTFRIPLPVHQHGFKPANHDGQVLKNYTMLRFAPDVPGSIAVMRASSTDSGADWNPAIGDFINIGNRLVQITDRVGARSETTFSEASVRIDPHLGAVNDAITITQPFIRARAVPGNRFTLAMSGSLNDRTSIEFVEAV